MKDQQVEEPPQHASDDVLLAAIATGNRSAFALLMRRHVRAASSLAVRMTGNGWDASDVVQDAFLRVWTKAGGWDANGGAQFSTWLYRVVINLSIDRKRRPPLARLCEEEEPVDPGPAGVEHVAGEEGRALIAQALACLPDRQRAAIALYYFEQISGPETARILELSLSATEALLVRGRRGLRKFLLSRGIKTMGDLI